MNRQQFDHLLRAAASIVGDDELLVIGSQAILGCWPDEDIPARLLVSQEVDLVPADDSQGKRDLIDGSLGEFSMFHETFGVWAHGVARSTAILPPGWDERLVPYRSAGTAGTTALCLDAHDLWIAKAMRGEPRDYAYCEALIKTGKLDRDKLATLLDTVQAPVARVAQARALLR